MSEPVKHLYQNHVFLVGAGIADVQHDFPFNILMTKFGKSSHDLLLNQHIATSEEQPTSLLGSHIPHGGIPLPVLDTEAKANLLLRCQ